MLCAIPLAIEIRDYFLCEASRMTQLATPTETQAPLTAVEGDGLFEIVEGQVVEKKPMGVYENVVASFLHIHLGSFARAQTCGRAVSETLFDFGPGLPQRRPDVAYVSYERWPRQRRVPRTQAWAVVPDLAVEVISPSNTFGEVLGKVQEYFQAGVQVVWVVAPAQQQVYVYQSPSRIQVVTLQEALTGKPFLPGFRLALVELFDVEATEA
jgi:Uma2 family endonuclease